MKKTLVQFAAILVVSLVCGAGYSFYLKSKDSPSYLAWSVEEGRYLDPLKCEKPKELTPPPPPGPEKTKEEKTEKTGETEVVKDPPPPPPPPPEKRTDAGALMIGVEQAITHWKDGTLFIDARRTKDYVKGHIQGARHIPAWENSRGERVAQLAQGGEVAHEEPIIVYCTRDEGCPDSKMISGDLIAVGFTDVMVFVGGYGLWTDNKGAVTEGEEPGPRGGG